GPRPCTPAAHCRHRHPITETTGMPIPGSGFADVDRAGDPEYWVGYLDRLAAQWPTARPRAHDLLDARAGSHILDGGSGTGAATLELAERVGGAGRVVGIDRSEAMVREARRRAEGRRLAVEFRPGDAHHLESADHTFDGCRAERVFTHLERPQQALAE